jgi:hypothetical protein
MDCCQCYGTVVIYCGCDCGSGSSSYFGKVLVPAPAPVPVSAWFQFRIQTYLAQFYKKYVQNLAFSMIEAVLFPGKFVSNIDF